jgi:H+-transporting ATPase
MDILASAPSLAGLTAAEVQRRLLEHGPNVVAEGATPRRRALLAKFWSPIPWMLEAAIILQIVLRGYTEAAVIAVLLIFNGALGFVQERRAGGALAALKKRLAPTAMVLRDGAWTKQPASDLVPGDVVALSLGGLVPADARVMSGSALIDQSTLTGESIPIDANPGSQVYAGSLVRGGEAVAEVTATGSKTYFGRTVELVRVAHAASTEQSAVLGVTRNLAIINGAIAIVLVGYAYSIALPSTDLVRLALTALLATIPVALPATFTLSAAFGAQVLAQYGVLLTRLSAAHEAAAMDVLCADKTGTLTRNDLRVVEVVPLLGNGRNQVLAAAALTSSPSRSDLIDAAIRDAAMAVGYVGDTQLLRFVPFDPATKTAAADVADSRGHELRAVKGAFEVVSKMAEVSSDARALVDGLAAQGHRVIAVAIGPPAAIRLIGLIAISDPPREESAPLIAELGRLGVRTVMVTGDSAVTAAAIAQSVGISGEVRHVQPTDGALDIDQVGVFARVLPEEKYHLVKALQEQGHVVGMCGDGVNDAPALRQAQIGIAVSSATDAAKAAAGMVLTEPGLAGIVHAVREGRTGFQRLLTYTFTMIIKKTEIVLFLAAGLLLTGNAIMTPTLMVLMFITNDILAMSLTTDRASLAPSPSVWRMRNITIAAVLLGICKLGFSVGVLAFGQRVLGLDASVLQTLAFATIVFGNQALLLVMRERRRMWASMPSVWVLVSCAAGIMMVSVLGLSGTLMAPASWRILASVFLAAMAFALILDQLKRPILQAFKVAA